MVTKLCTTNEFHQLAQYQLYHKNVPCRPTGDISASCYRTVGGCAAHPCHQYAGNCYRSNGIITISASGGIPPYSYNIDGSYYQSSAIYFVSGPSTHTMGVKDALGATATTTVAVGNGFTPPSVIIQGYQHPSGCATRDASVTLAGSGGTPPYTYSLDGANFQTANVFSGLAPGWYVPLVKDANGCTAAYPYIFTLNAASCSRQQWIHLYRLAAVPTRALSPSIQCGPTLLLCFRLMEQLTSPPTQSVIFHPVCTRSTSKAIRER